MGGCRPSALLASGIAVAGYAVSDASVVVLDFLERLSCFRKPLWEPPLHGA